MSQAPVPARFQHRLAWPLQLAEKAGVTFRACSFDPCLFDFAPRFVLCAEHPVTLVNVDPNVVHKNSSFPFSPSLRCAELFSCYLTPAGFFPLEPPNPPHRILARYS